MKILIYGAGVIGVTYGWQLCKAGYDITMLVREDRKSEVETNGITIHYTDYRNGQKQTGEETFFPKVTDPLTPDHGFEYILICVNYLNLKEVLPVLKDCAGEAHILFFQNIWDDFEEIAKHLNSEQYFFGFPFMAGGGKSSDTVNTVISGSKYSKTMLGESNGEVSPRIQKLSDALEKADMKPFISSQIIDWLVPHCVFIAALSAGVLSAGGTMERFLKNTTLIKKSVKAIREGFQISCRRGIDPKKEKVNKLYYLPFFICIPIMKKIFSNEDMSLMLDGYLSSSHKEITKMLEDIINSGEKYSVDTRNLQELRDSII
ncbi:ketopantoate reductase family protein [Prevotella sp. 10(H)]|uniref:ketopantoate reductase family protein n=1 Tax=Prevotella sp. 10(H) TaxID=1158294 RepID=UPI0004A6CFE6|nr:2-dehydropantoate 2-reductase N-terminal domain-containing protein [Prevotella sp. 10(H)]